MTGLNKENGLKSKNSENGASIKRKREPAKRVLAAEIRKSTHAVDVDGMKRVLLPTGELCSRVFFVGALLDRSRTEGGVWKLRLADPTGAFYAFAGKFQPSVVEAIQEIDVPSIVAVAGKLRVFDFEGERGKLPYVRPEFIAAVDVRTRDLWLGEAVNRTLERLSRLESGLENGNPECRLAKEVYGDIEDVRKAVEAAKAALGPKDVKALEPGDVKKEKEKEMGESGKESESETAEKVIEGGESERKKEKEEEENDIKGNIGGDAEGVEDFEDEDAEDVNVEDFEDEDVNDLLDEFEELEKDDDWDLSEVLG